MEFVRECPTCGVEMERDEMVEHLEKIHVGPRQMDSIEVGCGSCSFQAYIGNLGDLIEHCSLLGHNADEISTNWTQFIHRETKRISAIVRLGVRFQIRNIPQGLEKGVQERKNSPQATPKSEHFYDSDRNTQTKRPKLSARDSPVETKDPTSVSDAVQRILIRNEIENGNVSGIHPFSDPKSSSTLMKSSAPSGIKTLGARKSGIKSEREDSSYQWGIIGSDETGGESFLFPAKTTREGKQKIDRALREQNPEEFVQCTLCPYKAPMDHMRQGALRHLFVHARELTPFQCSECDARSGQRHSFKHHAKTDAARQKGCTGGYLNVQTPEMIRETRALLLRAFPTILWDSLLPPGTSCGEINL